VETNKRINAPVGELGLGSLKISTAVLAGDDATYNSLENRLQLITIFRDALAARMLNRLEDAELHGQRIGDGEERALVLQANELVDSVKAVVAAEQIRGAMKDPDSFRLTSAFIVAADQPESGASCFEYRSRNSFNGYVMGQAVPGCGPLLFATVRFDLV
jgi:hypothetical protein